MSFDHLLSPLTIGPKTVRNRVLVTAHVPGLAENGVPGPAYAAYHRAKAAGGAGLQITGATPVHPSSGRAGKAIANLDDSVIAGYRMVSDAVHEEGGMILAQLAHYGATLGEGEPGNPGWGVTDQAADLYRAQPHAMTVADIHELIDSFAAAAGRAQAGGMDGVEILAAFGLLLAAFLSPYTNTRSDAYGGSLKNRLRLPLEVAEAVRGAAGPDLIVGMRVPGDEFVEGGIDIVQMREIAPRLAASGHIDYLNVIAGNNMDRVNRATHWPPTPAPHGLFVDLAVQVKQVVDIPVFTTGRITDPAMAEAIVAQGRADMVGMTRAQIADPELVKKLTEGRAEDIRPCVGANVCIKRALGPGPIRCLHNPEAAREHAWGPQTAAGTPRRVAVIGAGPGGLEAARVAAERGHKVTVYEAESHLGGQFYLRASIPTWAEFEGVINWRREQLEKLQVPIHLGRRITADDLPGLEADALILATGAVPKAPRVPGDGSVRVTTPHDLIRNGAGDAQTALIWDRAGGVVASGAMDAARDMGLNLHIVTPQFMVAEDTDVIQRVPLYERLLSEGAQFHPNCDLADVAGGTVTLRNVYSYAETQIAPVDLIVAWDGRSVVEDLRGAAEAQGIEAHVIGDASAPRTAEFAMAEAAMLARRL
ncbi:oxidoreductase [Marimonas lutisalis]|uniref:oxidoreductase n=1 Tax=Marimonas lutisalis TaxID=2545756 RepID=UPI0010FA1331|nr:FAD-dependent oxidoreductase [Marimonas lutisalis]